VHLIQELLPRAAARMPADRCDPLKMDQMTRRLSAGGMRTGRRTQIGVAALLSHRLGFAALVSLVSLYYLFLLSNGTFRLFAPEMLDKAFDSMLLHLLHGEFTVDPQAIDFEAFTRNGKTYAYFGIFPALLRLVALPFTDVAHLEFARISCLTAVVIFVALQLRMLLIVHDSLPAASRAHDLLAVMVAATVLSGPQVYILGSASIYFEPILWSAAMAAGFNLIVLRAALDGEEFRPRYLAILAVLAGLAINTRVSGGVGLYLGASLLVAWRIWRRYRLSASPVERCASSLMRDPGVYLPVAILGLLAAASGLVNFERFGNAFTFADFRDYGWLKHHASFVAAFHNYGEFNLGRVWIGVLYYATGIPYLLKSMPLFAQYLSTRVAGIEAPPIVPLLTNPITVLLAGLGLYRLWRDPRLPPGSAAILRLTLIGNAAAVLLILAAMFLTLRFRFDFAAFMTLAALIGYRSLSIAAAEARQIWRNRLRITAIGLCVLGILCSHYVLLIHKVWSIGVPMNIRLALLPFAPFARGAFEP
jgi:hypothetical protein